MKQIADIMGMPISIEVADPQATSAQVDQLFDFFRQVDAQFSTYKPTSEISQINAGTQLLTDASPKMQEILALCEATKVVTNGYFTIERNGYLDPSGLVKGWSIYEAAKQAQAMGLKHFMLNAGGDIQVVGLNRTGEPWRVGIRHPFEPEKIVKVVIVTDRGVATSGTMERGQHIYNPYQPTQPLEAIVSLTVIGPNIYEADRFATAAFAMGAQGIEFIEELSGFEAYQIDASGQALMTTGFEQYVVQP